MNLINCLSIRVKKKSHWTDWKRSDMMAKVPLSQIKLSRGRRDTHLCVLTQVDPFGDVVDGGDPLEEEAAEGR